MYNHEFQVIDTEFKAYVLGLWYADGGLSNNNSVKITLHKDDEELINKIKELFPFFNINTNGNALVLSKMNEFLVGDFRSHGALERKSYENKDFLKIPEIREDLLHHFIRGFFDGDGSVFVQKINNIKVEIGGAGFPFITQLLKVLYDKRIDLFMKCRHPEENNERNQDFYVIYTSSYTESKKFADYIYRDSNIFMSRKKELLTRELISRNSKERLQCEHCSSTNTVYIGFRREKVRLFCKDCKKRSTQTAPDSSNIISGEDELLES